MSKRFHPSSLFLFVLCLLVTLLVGCGEPSQKRSSFTVTPTNIPVRKTSNTPTRSVPSPEIPHPVARLGRSITDFRLVLGNEFALNKNTNTYEFQQDPHFPEAQYEVTVDDIKKPIPQQRVIKIKFNVLFDDNPLSEHDANRKCGAFLPSDAVTTGHYRPEEYGFTADYFYSAEMKNEFRASYFTEVDGTLVRPGAVYILYGWSIITTGVLYCYIGLGR
ncbi:hypothetical protein [Ktedonobacter racemifer]|uniref:Lipoprotein n=1 Tax=Ktedonobacter racemifer DSM 44963 TaxID=485913 RepID=D6TH01_KTERA|nr:hypothetical protein [Ktedonobacter racemifer]EFH88930.1 hypothetical protein Krac_10444 [Ktedonobacter racemifer DSM 44963]